MCKQGVPWCALSSSADDVWEIGGRDITHRVFSLTNQSRYHRHFNNRTHIARPPSSGPAVQKRVLARAVAFNRRNRPNSTEL